MAQLKILGPPPEPPRCELRVRGRLHSRARDQAVIAGHYDLPAAFYQLILDPSMAYSCAYWSPGHNTLADAQRAKLELIGGKLGLEPGQRLLDMGCGWGSLTIHAARARVQVTGVTLSREQGGYVRQRARGLGLGDRAEVRIQDYRDPLDDRYNAVASVEMGEHVGAAQYPRFCAALHDRLRPGGRLLIQQMSRGARAPGGGPFIESYITPDMDMRPVGDTVRLIENAGFEVIGVEAMRDHYVRTIRAWLDNFEQNQPAIKEILSEQQILLWRLYLAGGALAFEEGRMGVDQILAVRRAPECPVSGLPAGPFAVTLASTAAALLVMMAVTFAIAIKVGKHSVVDTAWGIGLALVALVGLVSSIGYGQPARRVTLAVASVIWGLRLAVYIGSRNRGQPEDPRYRDLLSRAKGDKNLYALRTIYLLQALILWVACLPIQAGLLERAPAGPITIVGAAVWLGGFVFESVGDWQLARFKADPAHKGQIMDRGLWRYTRHPNYFGDFCMWWALFLISLGSWAELPTIVGPLLMTLLLTRGSGQRLTERRMADRPQYADYVARTSGFFPRPPKPPHPTTPLTPHPRPHPPPLAIQ